MVNYLLIQCLHTLSVLNTISKKKIVQPSIMNIIQGTYPLTRVVTIQNYNWFLQHLLQHTGMFPNQIAVSHVLTVMANQPLVMYTCLHPDSMWHTDRWNPLFARTHHQHKDRPTQNNPTSQTALLHMRMIISMLLSLVYLESIMCKTCMLQLEDSFIYEKF